MKIKLSDLSDIFPLSAIHFDTVFNGVSIDSRTVSPNDIFIALHGKNFDGHNYIKEAIYKGASAVISEVDLTDIPYIKVKDTHRALIDLALYYSSIINPNIIGITGTNGKTTVTDLTAKITGQYKSTTKTFGNFNNNIGLPLSILKSKIDSEIFVLEMGASKEGDIKELLSIAKPDIVALLNVSPAHLDTFGTLENILSTKEEIFLNQGFDKKVILNKCDQYFDRWVKKNKLNNIITISKDDQTADYSAMVVSDKELSVKTPYEPEFKLRVINTKSHNILNILFSIALASEIGARSEHILSAMTDYDGVEGRSKVYAGINNSKIIDSSYNANPQSFEASINDLLSFPGKRWVVMGQMGELGKKSEEYHVNLALYAAKNHIDKLFIITEHNQAVIGAFGDDAHAFNSTSDLIDFIKPLVKNNTNILVKASRFMGFETIVDDLKL
jgi:UDP-N-acetylmuramoyl-tripeptide--D-alanyl-D-alanine ligase